MAPAGYERNVIGLLANVLLIAGNPDRVEVSVTDSGDDEANGNQ
jgi:hypothetical protein